jgi:hypothetical protein
MEERRGGSGGCSVSSCPSDLGGGEGEEEGGGEGAAFKLEQHIMTRKRM